MKWMEIERSKDSNSCYSSPLWPSGGQGERASPQVLRWSLSGVAHPRTSVVVQTDIISHLSTKCRLYLLVCLLSESIRTLVHPLMMPVFSFLGWVFWFHRELSRTGLQWKARSWVMNLVLPARVRELSGGWRELETSAGRALLVRSVDTFKHHYHHYHLHHH